MPQKVIAGKTFPLWPKGAPGAMGDGPADRPTLTPYLPAGKPKGPRGCVIVFPGGGYQNLAPHEKAPIAEWLAGLGLASFVLEYRVAPYRHPIPLGDAQRAIRLVRARAGEWAIDPRRIGILGFSAGGHLVASAATIFDAGNPEAADPIDRESSRPDALIACYAVLSYHIQGRGCISAKNLMGDPPPENLLDYLSLDARVAAETPPTFLWHTADDPVVPVANSLAFAGALRKSGVPMALHVFPHGRHGVGLADDNPVLHQWTTLCENWLGEIGFLP